jgi:hypothetical protein
MYPLFAEFVAGDRWQVCLADCPDYLSFETLADILYSEHLRGLEQTDVLIVRPRVDLPTSAQEVNADKVRALVKRAPHSSIHILSSNDYELRLSSNLNASAEDKLPNDAVRSACLKWLQDKELYHYVKHSSALFQARPNFVYRAPSQRHVNMFLRVGNVQRSRQVLDAFFFWMLPYLKGRDAILTDTWSISSIALNAGRFLERYWALLQIPPGEAGWRSDRRCRVDMLSAYPDDLLVVTPETRDVIRRVDEDGQRNVLVLLSAVATGNSLARLQEVVSQSQHREGEFAFLALYKLDATQKIPALCDLSSGVGEMKFAAITRGEVGDRTVIEIDRSTYFPLDIRETPLLISDAHAAPAKEFFTEYRNSSVVSLHKNAVDLSNQEHRHHGVYFDVEAMLATSRFNQKLRAAIATFLKPPALIVTPPHRAGKVLADKVAREVANKWRVMVEVFVHPDLRMPLDSTLEYLKATDSESVVLVVDDVSVTGQRLSRYQQSLRELKYSGQIVYLLGVARPDSDKNWTRRVNQLMFRTGHPEKHRVICIEKVIVPDWDRKTCPWCVELKALTQLVEQNRLDASTLSAVVQRLLLLERATVQRGLIDEAIWRPQGVSALQLTQNSIFIDTDTGPATEADVVASVAAALQQMRIMKSEDKRLEVTYPHVSVLDSENYFGMRFNDDLLRFAILRSAKAPELERWDGSAEENRSEKVHEFLQNHENREVFTLELAVARLARKVPQPDISADEWANMEGWPISLWRAFSAQ